MAETLFFFSCFIWRDMAHDNKTAPIIIACLRTIRNFFDIYVSEITIGKLLRVRQQTLFAEKVSVAK